MFAVGIVALLESRLGLSPWDVLHQGIDRRTPITFGLANVLVGVVVLVAVAITLANLLADFTVRGLDPRVRLGRTP